MTKHEEALKKFKPGDRVRVMRKIVGDEDGWPLMWVGAMNKYVGKICVVSMVDARGVRMDDADGFFYPTHVLMPEHSIFGYFQKGDRVRVREKCADRQYGWNQVWNKHSGARKMEVGVVGTIVDIVGNTGVQLDNGCFFPEWTLDHAPAEEAKAPEPELKFETGAYAKLLRAHSNKVRQTEALVGTIVRLKKVSGADGAYPNAMIDVPGEVGGYTWARSAFELVPAPAPAAPSTSLARNRDPDREVQTFKVGGTVRVVCKPEPAPAWNAPRMNKLVYRQGVVDGHTSSGIFVNVLIEGEERAWSFPPNSLMLVKNADGDQAPSGSTSKPTVQQRGAFAGKSGEDMAKEQRVLRCRSFDGTKLGDEDVYFWALENWIKAPYYDGWIWSSGKKHEPSSCWYVVEVLPYDDSFALLREVYGTGDVLGGLGDKADAARAAVALAKGGAGVPAATPDAISADGKTVIDFKVGDCGKTRGGGNYEVLKIDCVHEYLGINQPIWAHAQENIETPFRGYFAPDGTFAVGKSNADLMPPTHNINDAKWKAGDMGLTRDARTYKVAKVDPALNLMSVDMVSKDKHERYASAVYTLNGLPTAEHSGWELGRPDPKIVPYVEPMFKVGDYGETSGGHHYVVTSVTATNVYDGKPQPLQTTITDKVTKKEYKPCHHFTDGKLTGYGNPWDLQPPQGNIAAVMPGPIVEAPPEEERCVTITPRTLSTFDMSDVELRIIASQPGTIRESMLYGSFAAELYGEDSFQSKRRCLMCRTAAERTRRGDGGLYDYQRTIASAVAKCAASVASGALQPINLSNIPRSTTSQESTMSKSIKIKTITYLNSTPVTDYNQDAFTQVITNAEAELDRLRKIGPKTKALKAQIAELEAEIQQVVELSDARYAADNPGETVGETAAAAAADA